jgi:H+/Cl- antiporter ClcA
MRDMGRLGQLRQKAVDNALIVGGGAAGVSAAFNAPLAGIVFAVESLAQSLEKRNSGILIVSIFISGVVVLALSGDYSHFGTPEATLMLADSWLGVLVTGLSCGVLGGLFARVLVSGSRALVPVMRAEPLKLVFLCGLLIASLGVVTGGETFGTGYEQVRDLLDAQRQGQWTFPLAKMAATLASYFSGIPGGLFSPSMAAGAGVGAVVSKFMPDAALVGLVMVGMASFLSGVLQRPLVSFVIVMEMTSRHDILLALMLGSLVAFGVSRLLMRAPLFEILATDLVSGPDRPTARGPGSPNPDQGTGRGV